MIPKSWARFLQDYPELNRPPEVLPHSKKLMARLIKVNKSVNNKRKYPYVNLRRNSWNYLAEGESGDCQDKVVTKLIRLVHGGLPAGAFHPAVCEHPTKGIHAILIVTTSKGEYVLNNLSRIVARLEPVFRYYRPIACHVEGEKWKRIT